MSKIKRIARIHIYRLSLVLVVALLAGGCRQDMHDQPRYETYEAGAGRVPLSGCTLVFSPVAHARHMRVARRRF